MGTMRACEMRTLSSMELMLLKIQQAEEEQLEDSPPALPSRPVMKARLPRPRKKLPFMFTKSDFHEQKEKNAEEGEEKRELQKGVVIIQKCYRGHQACSYYHDLKRGAITLQSCIRGSLARREFVKQVTSQEAKTISNKIELTKVPEMVLHDLGRKVLISEAALERKKDENDSLKKLIVDYENKLKEREVRMQYLEKMWQDQLTSIQTNLAEAKRRHAAAAAENGSSRLPETTSGRITLEASFMLNADSESSSQLKSQNEASNFSPKDDLAKLKLRFEAWTKEYKNRLQEAKTTMKQMGHPAAKGRSLRIWCGR